MLNIIKKFFSSPEEGASGNKREIDVRDLRVATCALFLEMASIDGEFSEVERKTIFSILNKEFGLPQEVAEELADAAENELGKSIDLWKFTNLINEHYAQDDKLKIIEMIWKVIYSDGKLSMHEDYLIHKLASLLNIEHRQLITMKVKVLHGQ